MKRIIPIIVILAAIGGGYWWLNQPQTTAQSSPTGSSALVGSGSIEAETVAITAELGGRVVELTVDEGDEVKAGQILVELDKSELLTQKMQLEAALTTAQTNLELVSALARPEDIAVAEAKLAQSEVAADGAEQTWRQAQALVNNPTELEAKVNQARAVVVDAEYGVEMAQVNLKRADIQAEAAGRNQLNHEALVQNEVAHYQLQAAQTGVKMAETMLEGAKRQVEHWEKMRSLPLQFVVQANSAEAAYHQTEAAVLMAEANLAAVEAGPTAEDIAVAQAQVSEAEAALDTIEVYLNKTTLTAPRGGLITKKLINPGELAAPGSVLLELSDISTVDLIVYIPETRIGEIQIGHPARVFVDAYGDEKFDGTVTFIAHQAEFTPRTVQTQEERVNLVFAVKITLTNPDHRLKPGMPADAEILTTSPPSPIKKPSSSSPSPSTKNTATPRPAQTATPTSEPAKPKAVSTKTPTPTPVQMQAQVVAWGLNVRSGPGVDYPTIATLSQDDTVLVVDVDAKTGWLQVALPGSDQTGWITGSSSYVLLIE